MAGTERDLVIRRAFRGEAAGLSALAMRSKAHWGYSKEFLDDVRPMLTFTEADLATTPVHVLDAAGHRAGVYRLSVSPPDCELEDLWLDPQYIGRGLGRQLLEHACRTAEGLGFASLLVESDPHAEGFYLAMGAVSVGTRRSSSGRTLPLLRIRAAAEISAVSATATRITPLTQ